MQSRRSFWGYGISGLEEKVSWEGLTGEMGPKE